MEFEFLHACCHSYFYTYLRYSASVYHCIQDVYQPDFRFLKVESSFPEAYFHFHQPRFWIRPPVHISNCISVYNGCIQLVYSFSNLQNLLSSTEAAGFPTCKLISSSSLLLFNLYASFEPLRLHERMQRVGVESIRIREEFHMR